MPRQAPPSLKGGGRALTGTPGPLAPFLGFQRDRISRQAGSADGNPRLPVLSVSARTFRTAV
jgi:hypothetical protein